MAHVARAATVEVIKNFIVDRKAEFSMEDSLAER
jgi:hypothetical protein